MCGAAEQTHQNNNSVNLKINENLTIKKMEQELRQKGKSTNTGYFPTTEIFPESSIETEMERFAPSGNFPKKYYPCATRGGRL